jgi:(p)ppGpp synthase/HD superfamily hydrolase
MFRKKEVISIHNIGSKDNEDNHNDSETTFIDVKWATEYCDTFLYNLKVDRFNKTS